MTPAHAQPAAAPAADGAYDHSRDKGKLPEALPGATTVAVKFRADREVRVRGNAPVAKSAQDADGVKAVLAGYKDADIQPMVPLSEKDVTDERVRLERETGRALPDMNSWFVVTVPGGVGDLATRLNKLPAVEIAYARGELVSPVADPLRDKQVYRDGGGVGIDADPVNLLPGGKGENITVTDIESGSAEKPVLAPGGMAVGDYHTLVVLTDSNDSSLNKVVRAYGDNLRGQLGTGTTTSSTVSMPVVGLTNVKAVAAAARFSVALKEDGTVWTWGDNTNGQLGDGTTTMRTTPVQVPGLTGVVSIAAGAGFVLAARSDGTVRAWGLNSAGQLGDGTTTNRLSPVTVTGLTGVTKVAAGQEHSLALRSDNTVRAWGLNSNGQLGNGTTTNASSPVTVTGLGTAQLIAAGAKHSLAGRTDGNISAWGLNAYGQLGDGTTTQRTSPVTVTTPWLTAEITAGNVHSAARGFDGKIRAWGQNAAGQLGNGTTTDSSVPVAVSTVPGNQPFLPVAGNFFTVAAGGENAWGWGTT
ncbi:RCC1 domain-containing protein [Actinokineospora sp. G85]|uniref:RCC1 domain-containing protein n=1 Tax=Actinokineospora sp. G85 TaxID=3406626 RepID=UPI003C709141